MAQYQFQTLLFSYPPLLYAMPAIMRDPTDRRRSTIRPDVLDLNGNLRNIINSAEINLPATTTSVAVHTQVPVRTSCTVSELVAYANWTGLRGGPFVAAIQLTEPPPESDPSVWAEHMSEQVENWFPVSYEGPTTLFLSALTQMIGIGREPAGMRDLLMEIYEEMANRVDNYQGDRYFGVSSSSMTQKERDVFFASQLSMEAKVMYRTLKSWTSEEGAFEGDVATAQAIFMALKTYYDLDFVLITPTGMVSTREILQPDTCVVQFLPDTREWRAIKRNGPRSRLERLVRVEGRETEFRPYFEKYLIFYRDRYSNFIFPNVSQLPWTKRVPWHKIDDYFVDEAERQVWAGISDCRNDFNPLIDNYWFSPYLEDIIQCYGHHDVISNVTRDFAWSHNRMTHCLFFQEHPEEISRVLSYHFYRGKT